MDFCIRSRLTSGLVVVGVSALIVAPVALPRSMSASSSISSRIWRPWRRRGFRVRHLIYRGPDTGCIACGRTDHRPASCEGGAVNNDDAVEVCVM